MMNRFQMSDIDKTANIHFIGIGGISMSGLAQIVLKDGYGVSGSDWNKSAITEKLENMGADIVYGHGAVNEDGINKASLVVYTAAAKADNPEIVLAKEKGIRLIDRAEFLGAIMKNYKHAVGVSGTHGKTTTTSMLAHALIGANLDPTISVGGELDLIGGNIRTGKSDYFVTEACEYTNSFLKFYPTIALITNVEEDHLDFFSGIDEIIASFRQFAYLTKDIGYVVAMGGDKNVQKVLENADDLNIITYGMESKFDYYPENIVYHAGFPSFDVMKNGEKVCHIKLNVPGEHNILNSLATVAVCNLMGVDAETAAKGIETFKGTHRRFEKKGFLNGAADRPAGPREPVHRGRNRHFIMREKLLCRTNRPKQWNRNSVHERIYRPSGLFRLLGSTAAPIYSALSYAGRPASAESAALPLVAGTIHRCGAAGCTGSGRARAAALLATQHDRGNSV